MKISLRAGEKIYVNGAVFSVDRRVSLHLLNDVTFLLENHVMQAPEATSPLRQAYFAMQTMLMDPAAAGALKPSVLHMLLSISLEDRPASQRAAIHGASVLLQSGRTFDALREVRELYRADEARAPPDRAERKDQEKCR